jgi:protein-S-isoprenylcysteine O-methyltransferase Ste14
LIRRPGVAACFAAIVKPELYRNFAIHLFVMFPAAMAMCWIGSKVDARLGLSMASRPLAGLALIGVGGVWVWYVYGYLCLSGGGSPGTHVDGGPTTMVDTGPYTAIRHPSVLGKMLGVVGLGLIWGSPAFLLGFVPVLVVYSVVTNRYLQERFCDARFGARYALYRRRVPMLLPRPDGLRRWLRDEAAVPEELPVTGASPPGIWMEFRGYLLGLLLLIGFFGAIAAAL